MSLKGIRKSIQNDEAPIRKIGASAHRLDEFPAGYSLTGCSPALPASASPAGDDYAAGLTQVRDKGDEERKTPYQRFGVDKQQPHRRGGL
jgi:hypothetical protein